MLIHDARLLTRKPLKVPRGGKAPNRQRSATTLRDHVLPLVRSRSQRHQYGCFGGVGPFHLMTWERDPLRFVLRVPFDPLSTQVAAEVPAGATLHRKSGGAPLPFGLDVWQSDRVLSVAWNRLELVVVTFRQGDWEGEVLALG